MKTFTRLAFLLAMSLYLGSFASFAQEEGGDDGFDTMNSFDQQNAISGLFGYNRIGEENFIGARFRPDIGIGKFGIGLDIPLFFNLSDGSLRTDEFKDGVGWLRIIRYLRWGIKKRDPLFIQVGDIAGTYLGYGLLANNYTNSVSFEKRKIGLSYDILIDNMWGVEGFYSDFNFASLNLFAIRPYVRPFGKTGIPIVKTIDVGFSYITDRDQTDQLASDSTTYNYTYTKDGFTTIGADMGVTFINRKMFRLAGYFQFGLMMKNDQLGDTLTKTADAGELAGTMTPEQVSMMQNYEAGTGVSVGLDAKIKFAGSLFRLDARLERLWYSDYFLPQFFDAVYEINKDGKIFSLGTAEKKQGIFGSLTATILDKMIIRGSLLMPDQMGVNAPGIVQFDMQVPDLIPSVFISGSYIKGGLEKFSDVIGLDERSLTHMRVAYKINKYMMAGIDYKWTYTLVEDGAFETTSHVMPYFGLNFPLNFGGGSSSSNNEY